MLIGGEVWAVRGDNTGVLLKLGLWNDLMRQQSPEPRRNVSLKILIIFMH